MLAKAVIQCIASVKRREKPTFISHPSVGTEDEIRARAEAKKSLESLQLSKSLLEPLIHSKDCLSKWGSSGQAALRMAVRHSTVVRRP